MEAESEKELNHLLNLISQIPKAEVVGEPLKSNTTPPSWKIQVDMTDVKTR